MGSDPKPCPRRPGELIAGRPRDLDDLEALLALHRVDRTRVRQRIAELAELAEAPEIVTAFDAATRRADGSGTDGR